MWNIDDGLRDSWTMESTESTYEHCHASWVETSICLILYSELIFCVFVYITTFICKPNVGLSPQMSA